ncbi:MAG: peptidylprolyl isomerase [Acidimicrobiales bacterium]
MFFLRGTTRVLILLFFVVLFGAACGSSDDATNADNADTQTDDVDAADGAESSDATPDAATGDPSTATADADVPDPVFVAQIGAAFLGGGVGAEVSRCLVDASEADALFAEAINRLAEAQIPLDEPQFASIVTTTRDCAGQDAFNLAFATGFANESQIPAVQECFAGEFAGDDTDGALISFAALTVGFPLPEGTEDATLAVLGRCITRDVLAGQLAVQYEQAQGFAVDVDVDCVREILVGIDPVADFWEAAVITGDTEKLDAVDALVAECASGAFDDLLQEVPADFEPWAGTGALAAVAPPARAHAYDAAPPMTIDPAGSYQAIITTSDGEIVLDLLADTAPVTVNNFVMLARDGYYDGTVFHRVLANFMAQGGDPTGSGRGGPGYQFEDEFDGGPALDARGLLAMANSGPGTNGSQFFITFVDVDNLTGLHTVFGRLVEGDDVLASVDLRDPDAPVSGGESIVSIRIIEN